jgi:hypothetical protein
MHILRLKHNIIKQDPDPDLIIPDPQHCLQEIRPDQELMGADPNPRSIHSVYIEYGTLRPYPPPPGPRLLGDFALPNALDGVWQPGGCVAHDIGIPFSTTPPPPPNPRTAEHHSFFHWCCALFLSLALSSPLPVLYSTVFPRGGFMSCILE